jgi:lipoprotein-releasing system permease protein
MKIEGLIARKYFFPSNRDFFRRISLISIITVFLSVFLPMLILGILNGFHQSMIQKMISKDFHIQAYDPSDTFYDYRDLIKTIEEENAEVQGYPYFEGAGILSKDLSKISVMVRGIVPEMLPHFPDFRMLEGKWEFDRSAVMLGAGVARKLDVKPGQIVKIYLRPYAKENQSPGMIIKRAIVSGVFRTGYDEIDSNLAFMPFNKAQLFYHYGDRASGVGFFVKDLDRIPDIKKQIKQFSIYLNVKDWEEMNRNILYSFEWEKNIMIVVLTIIILATLFSVYIAFNVVVADRRKEIGLLKLMGMRYRNIQQIFLLKGLLIGTIAIVLGTLVSFMILYNLQDLVTTLESSLSFLIPGFHIVSRESTYGGGLYFEWSFWDMGIVFVLNIFSILVATYYPVKRINRYTISESIRNV